MDIRLVKKREGNMPECKPLEEQFVGTSTESCEVRELVRTASTVADSVLLLGEPGTGKQLVAQLIHECSQRSQAPFLMIDCSLYYERELKRELFGYAEDSGKRGSRKGILEFAAQGTCYLSHVEELSPAIQSSILEYLKTSRFSRLGDAGEMTSGARLVVSSDKNLEGFVRSGLFDRELYQELSRFSRSLLPLRGRNEDIPQIIEAMCESFAAGGPEKRPTFAEEAIEALQAYPWPTNLDELKKEVTRLLEGDRVRITPENLSMEISSYWLGLQGDPEIRRVLEELDGYIREFRVMSRLNSEFSVVGSDLVVNEVCARDCYWDFGDGP
jgi:DNA-binding NtrC family response regulator